MQRPEGGLDGQFEKLVGQLSVLALSQPRAVKLRVQAWITKLREPTSNTVWKRNRNLYCALMLAQLQQGRLELPFTATPPDGALPNLPNHLAYRGLSPSRAAGNPRSRSSSPGGSAPRSGSPCGQAQQPQGHQLAACQLKGLVNTFQSNMQARGFDLSRPLASSKAASGAVPPKTAGALVSVGGRAAGGGALGTRGSSAGGVSLGRPCSRGRSLGRSVSSGSGVPGGAGKSGAWGDGGQRDQEHEPCLAWGETAAGDESYNDQDKVAAALLEAKEAEIAARVAAKRRQELEQRLQAEEAAKQQQRQRSAAAKAHLDAVITRYSEARQQWASPRGAGSPKTALGGRSAEPRTDAGAANWTTVSAAASGARSPSPTSPGTLKLLLQPREWTECGGPGAEHVISAQWEAALNGMSCNNSPAAQRHNNNNQLHRRSEPTLRLTSPQKVPSPPPVDRRQQSASPPAPRIISASHCMFASPPRVGSPLQGRASSCSPHKSSFPLPRSRSCSPAVSSPRRLPSADPTVLHNVTRQLRSSPRALQAAAAVAASQGAHAAPPSLGGGSAAGGDGSEGLLLPRLPVEEPSRRRTAPAKFEFSSLIEPLLSTATKGEAPTGGSCNDADAASEEGTRNGNVGVGLEVPGCSSGCSSRRGTRSPQLSFRDVQGAGVGCSGAANASASPNRSSSNVSAVLQHERSLSTSPFATSRSVAAQAAAAAGEAGRRSAEHALPTSSSFPSSGQSRRMASTSPPPRPKPDRQVPSLPLDKCSGAAQALHGRASTAAAGGRASSYTRLLSPPRANASAPVPSSTRLTEMARRSLAACLPGLPGSFSAGNEARSTGPADKKGAGLRHSWTGQDGGTAGHGRKTGAGTAIGAPAPSDYTVDLSPVATGHARNLSTAQETPRLLRRPAAEDGLRRALSAGCRRELHGPVCPAPRPRVSRPGSLAQQVDGANDAGDPAPAASGAATAADGGLLAGLSAAAAAGELEELDVEGVISDFERWLQDHLEQLRVAQAAMHETKEARRAATSQPAASSLADRFALYSALGDFRRAVDRLKRRLALHSSDPAVAELLFGTDQGGAPCRSRRLSSSTQRSSRESLTSSVSHPQAWRPGGSLRAASVDVDLREGAAGGCDVSSNPHLKVGVAERFYRAALDAVATYREDVALLLSRVKAVLQPGRQAAGASRRSSRDGSCGSSTQGGQQRHTGSGATSGSDATAACQELELRRGLVEEMLRMLQESAHQLGLRVVALASAPVGLSAQAVEELNATLCAHLDAAGSRLSERLSAVSKKAAGLHRKISQTLNGGGAETLSSGSKDMGARQPAVEAAVATVRSPAVEAAPGAAAVGVQSPCTTPVAHSRGGVAADSLRREGPFSWLGDMPTPSGRLDFGAHESQQPQQSGISNVVDDISSLLQLEQQPWQGSADGGGGGRSSRSPGAPHAALLRASSATPICNAAPAAAADGAGAGDQAEAFQSPSGSSEDTRGLGGLLAALFTSPPMPLAPAPVDRNSELSSPIPRQDQLAHSVTLPQQSSPAAAPSPPASLPHPRPSGPTGGTLIVPPWLLSEPAVDERQSVASSKPRAQTLHAMLPPQPLSCESPTPLGCQPGPPPVGISHSTAPQQEGSHLATSDPTLAPPHFQGVEPSSNQGMAVSDEAQPHVSPMLVVGGSRAQDTRAVSGGPGRPGQDNWHAGTAALRLVQEAQSARKAAVAARQAVEAAMQAASAASDAASANTTSVKAPRTHMPGDVLQPHRPTACSSVGSALTPQVTTAPEQQPQQLQQQCRLPEAGPTYRAVVWELSPTRTGGTEAEAAAPAGAFLTPHEAEHTSQHASLAGSPHAGQPWVDEGHAAAAAAAVAAAASYAASCSSAREASAQPEAVVDSGHSEAAAVAAAINSYLQQRCEPCDSSGWSGDPPPRDQGRVSPSKGRKALQKQCEGLPSPSQLAQRRPSPVRNHAQQQQRQHHHQETPPETPHAAAAGACRRVSSPVPSKHERAGVPTALQQPTGQQLQPFKLGTATELSMFRKLRQQLAASPPLGAEPSSAAQAATELRIDQRGQRQASQQPMPADSPGPADRAASLLTAAADVTAAANAVSLGIHAIRDYEAFQLVKRRLGLLEASPPNAHGATAAKGKKKTPPREQLRPHAQAPPPPPQSSLCSSAISAPSAASQTGAGRGADRALSPFASTAGSTCHKAEPLSADAAEAAELSSRLQRLADRTSKLQQRMALISRLSPPRS
ncbi:hypothetical protein Agub_g15496 [Astrephomene gubernaculifera]|uniref:DUF4485 domain-containing protein n=1 Tax=Astrephomene gubernaculifera TaxID=47775 RepID=A0AAD3E5D1_9CHLO|nr:hypothetical protein Agub_g15496 [Astrephomene gubernaculifera]